MPLLPPLQLTSFEVMETVGPPILFTDTVELVEQLFESVIVAV